jgi:hypothetical protein
MRDFTRWRQQRSLDESRSVVHRVGAPACGWRGVGSLHAFCLGNVARGGLAPAAPLFPANNGNYHAGNSGIGSPYYRTNVGEFERSDSPYGTFDQGGNAYELTESLVNETSAVRRGGSFAFGSTYMGASTKALSGATYEHYHIGFRIASVSAEPGPDLVVPLLAHNALPLVSRYLSAGQVYVRWQAANQGALASGTCVLRFWLSADRVLDGSDRFLGLRAVRSLVPGQRSGVATALLRLGRWPCPDAPAYLIAEVDSDGVVDEVNEGNNTTVMTITAP